MTARTSPLREASQLAGWILRDTGRELKVARVLTGLSQVEVGTRIGRSGAWVSRVEHGLIAGVKMRDLTRHAAAIGLKPWIRLYPTGHSPMDGPQLATFDRFRARIGAAWAVQVEVPMPIDGDLRAADALISTPGCRCLVEVITRLADWQAQVRAARLKHRDLGTDRLILVVAATTTNRRVLREVGAGAREWFPIGTRDALLALGRGEDPGGNAIILI